VSRCARLSVWSGQKAQGEATVRLTLTMTIGARAIGANKGIIYCRAEYPLAIERVSPAIDQAKEYGLLGKDIFGTGFDFDIEIMMGAGAFVCGEETALMRSLEGNRGMPVPKPPFPANSWMWKKPTVINNVETLANVPVVITRGGEWFAKIGTEKSPGTKVFALTGKINNSGLIEVPMGTTLREIIFGIGGGIPNNRRFKAVQTGGPSGGCLPESLLDMPVDFDSLTAAGSMMGSGGMIVMDDQTCMVDVARYFIAFLTEESCSKCTPCREGLRCSLDVLTRITEGKGEASDIPLLEEMGGVMQDACLCALGSSAPNPVLSTLRYFRDEYEAHIAGRCPAHKCRALIRYTITDKCIGCTRCSQVCPTAAILPTPYEQHTIDVAKCVRCGACRDACPTQAVSVESPERGLSTQRKDGSDVIRSRV
jgi:NADH:ubiquinone oxidoreductase subunit F (NADH-binding)/Pyruvate/2-oxoacid:ferredoxin oxidoreductase delta subunit